MADKDDEVAARSLLDTLGSEQAESDSILLDAGIGEYVRAELAGEPAARLYPRVHRHILANESAQRLYQALVEIEKLSIDGRLPSVAGRSAQPTSVSERERRTLDLAQRIAARLLPTHTLRFQSIATAFFALRATLPPVVKLGRGGVQAFAAMGDDVPDEVRWLEAVYQIEVLATERPDIPLADIARLAAANAGLPRRLRRMFATEYIALS